MTGKIIVIEGTDSSGKETQTKLLEKSLQKEGIKCVHFAFPMYDTPTGRIIGGDYLGKEEFGESLFAEGTRNVDPKVVCLYYAADRKYNWSKIEDFLKQGYIVILDRYTTSNLAHQGSKLNTQEERFNMYQWIDKLEYWLLQLPKPDKTIFLHVPYEYSLKTKSVEEQKRAEEAYIELSELYNWDRVECVKEGKLRSVEDIHKEILDIVKEV